MVATP
ncbi:hypothetical protein YPPY03_4092, partial [Yersinia pestis PY-03]